MASFGEALELRTVGLASGRRLENPQDTDKVSKVTHVFDGLRDGDGAPMEIAEMPRPVTSTTPAG
jgi:hypothetical protein